jgi:ankyrin repeat protein
MGDLWQAARKNDVGTLNGLFEKGIGIKGRDEQGNTLLHHAAECGALDVIALLVQRGAEVDAKNIEGLTVRF